MVQTSRHVQHQVARLASAATITRGAMPVCDAHPAVSHPQSIWQGRSCVPPPVTCIKVRQTRKRVCTERAHKYPRRDVHMMPLRDCRRRWLRIGSA